MGEHRPNSLSDVWMKRSVLPLVRGVYDYRLENILPNPTVKQGWVEV